MTQRPPNRARARKILGGTLMVVAVALALTAGAAAAEKLRGPDRSDVGVPMYDNEGPAALFGLGLGGSLSIGACWLIRRALGPRS